MLNQKLWKKACSAVVIAMLAVTVSGCTGEPEESVSEPETTVSESASETETEAETETEPETETETETEPEAETEIETEPETEAVTVMTNAELLALINSAFGIMTDNTTEGNIQAAREWNIIGEDDLDPDAQITPEFLISACIHATGFIDVNASMEEILSFAAEKGVIAGNTISDVDITQAAELVEKAKQVWMNPDFENKSEIELGENVIIID